MFSSSQIYANSPADCGNRWCTNPGTIPATGSYSPCGSLHTLDAIRLKNGGLSGRGVTPCPYGHFRHTSNIQDATKQIFFEPNRPGSQPPNAIEVRSLIRIGNDWRTS